MVKHVPLFSITPVNRKQMAEKNIYLIDFFENYFVDDSIFFNPSYPAIFWSMAAVSVLSTVFAMMLDLPEPGPPSKISGTSGPLPST